MTTQQIANRLVELCRTGDFEKAQKELFAEDVISIEPEGMEGFDKETKGLKAVLKKGEMFQSMVEKVYACAASEPLVTGNAIAFILTMDMAMKGRPRSKSGELCVYQVKDGKIVSEQFYM
jgi:hypothetical protein